MAKDAAIFDKKSADRISKNVLWGEQQRQRGGDRYAYEHVQPHETIYVQLIEKDPAGEIGYWSAQEVYYKDGRWELIETDRVWDGDAQPYIHHYAWGEAEIQQIVKLMLVSDVQTGGQDWVFDTDVTNPEAFVFYSDQNGNGGQALKDSTWTMRTAGKVLTNVGEASINAPFTIQPGQACQVVITFIDYGNGFQLSSAVMTTGEGQYWSNGSDGSIIVQHRIAKANIDGDMVRLEQYHAGDIHLEVFGVADEEDDGPTPTPSPLDIQGDNDWIDVTRLGNLYTVSHKAPPGAGKAMASMKGLDTTFSCDEVSFASFADVNTWVNDQLLAKIREIFYDTRGHIYDLKDCAGSSVTPTEDPTSVYLESSLTSSYVSGSDFGPSSINGNGLNFTYKILNQGANYLDYIATKRIQVGVIMANGQAVQIAIDGGQPILFNQAFFAENVEGTSGLRAIDTEAPGELVCGTERYRFNSTADLHVSVITVGLVQTATFNTMSCAATNNISGPSTIRNYDDPNAEAMTISVGYSIANLGTAISPGMSDTLTNGPYLSELSIKYADGTPVSWSTAGSAGPFKTTTRFLELDATSTTGVFDKIWFKLRDSDTPGDQIKICSKLLTLPGLTDANVESCDLYSISSEDDCITDESGVRVADDTDTCITDNGNNPLVDLPAAPCVYPGIGKITATSSLTNSGFANYSSGDDWANVKSMLDTSTTTLSNVALFVGIFNSPPNNTGLQRWYSTFDTSGLGAVNISARINWSSNQINRKFVIVYTTDPEPVVTNVTYDMSNWTVLGTINNPTSSSETIDFDCDNLPRNASLRIGIMIINDYQNDATGMTGTNIPTNGFRLGSVEFYKCS